VTSANVLLATVTLRADGAAGEQSTLNITTSSLINTTDDQILPRSATDGTFTVGANIVSIADVTLPWGSTQDVPIRLLGSTGVGGGQVTLTFNESIVNTTNVVAGAFDNSTVFSPDYSNVSDGVLRVTFLKAGENLTGDLTIATVTLHAVAASGSCELGLYAELVMANGSDVSSTVSNGTFTVNTTAATTPPAPENLQYTINGDWVNYTWQAGSIGPGTDSYNVSLGGVWDSYNGTATSLNSSVGAGNWSNITVWAYNNTGSGNMSLNNVSDEVQAGLPKDGDINGDDVLNYKDGPYLVKHVLGISGFETIYADGDINGDGVLNYKDGPYLVKHVLGISGFETIYS
jgi:hypothetical protein